MKSSGLQLPSQVVGPQLQKEMVLSSLQGGGLVKSLLENPPSNPLQTDKSPAKRPPTQ